MNERTGLIIVFLIFCLVVIRKIYYRYIKYITKKIQEENEKNKLIFLIDSLRKENANLKLKIIAEKNFDSNLKEAVKYAMVHAHPDNGGEQEDFIKFQECYKRLK